MRSLSNLRVVAVCLLIYAVRWADSAEVTKRSDLRDAVERLSRQINWGWMGCMEKCTEGYPSKSLLVKDRAAHTDNLDMWRSELRWILCRDKRCDKQEKSVHQRETFKAKVVDYPTCMGHCREQLIAKIPDGVVDFDPVATRNTCLQRCNGYKTGQAKPAIEAKKKGTSRVRKAKVDGSATTSEQAGDARPGTGSPGQTVADDAFTLEPGTSGRRGRGRPRTNPNTETGDGEKKGRGRPRKNKDDGSNNAFSLLQDGWNSMVRQFVSKPGDAAPSRFNGGHRAPVFRPHRL